MRKTVWKTRENVQLTNEETLEVLESAEQYTLPKIAKKLETGKPLEELEIIMAAATIRDWLRIKKTQTGRPPAYKNEQDRLAARRATYARANAKRRKKKESEAE